MLYKDWKKEVEHHRGALDALGEWKSIRYRINDRVEACVLLTASEVGFQLTLYEVEYGNHVDLARLAHGDLIHVVNLHEALNRYVTGGTDLPDPAIWNRPER